jgi:NitT/TauT family transport system permease protein
MGLSTLSTVKVRLPRKRKPGQFGRTFIVRSVSITLGLTLWEALTGWIYPSILIPSLFQVIVKGYELLASGEIFVHIGMSLFRILTGFLIGSLVGAPLGLLMGSLRQVRDALDPYVQFFRFVPSIAWLTPAVIWFGIGEMSKVTIIVYTTVFIVAINTMVGVSNIAPNKIWAALTLGATRKQVFIFIVLPASLPFILTGMRLAMGNSFATVVSAEMISSEQGLGYLIFNSRLWMATDIIFLSILLLGVLGLGTDLLFRRLIRRFAHQFGPVE